MGHAGLLLREVTLRMIPDPKVGNSNLSAPPFQNPSTAYVPLLVAQQQFQNAANDLAMH